MVSAAIKVYIAVFLFRDDHVLLLRRSEEKAFAPGLWTGIGGRMEPQDMGNVERAALREIGEETGLSDEEVRDLKIRVVFTQPEGGNISIVIFCTGSTDRVNVGPCKEGDLEWIELSRTSELPMIENAARALKIATVADARESLCVQFGVCSPKEGGLRFTLSPDPSPL